MLPRSYLRFATKSKPFTKQYHLSIRNENNLIYGGLAIAAGSIAAQYAYRALYPKTNQPESNDVPINSNNESKEKPDSTAARRSETVAAADSFISSIFGTTFYDGGFEPKMNKREAALILGVREWSTVDRIKEAHRRILILNHPDKGGSAYMAAKINEAKDLLLKSRSN